MQDIRSNDRVRIEVREECDALHQDFEVNGFSVARSDTDLVM